MKTFNPTRNPMRKPLCKLAKAWCLTTMLFSHVGFACDDVIFNSGFEAQFQVSVNVIELGNNTPGRFLELQLNGSETLSITTNGQTSFCTSLPINSNYQVTIINQPQNGNACVLSNQTGTLTADTTVTATCGDSRWDQFNWDEAHWN